MGSNGIAAFPLSGERPPVDSELAGFDAQWFVACESGSFIDDPLTVTSSVNSWPGSVIDILIGTSRPNKLGSGADMHGGMVCKIRYVPINGDRACAAPLESGSLVSTAHGPIDLDDSALSRRGGVLCFSKSPNPDAKGSRDLRIGRDSQLGSSASCNRGNEFSSIRRIQAQADNRPVFHGDHGVRSSYHTARPCQRESSQIEDKFLVNHIDPRGIAQIDIAQKLHGVAGLRSVDGCLKSFEFLCSLTLANLGDGSRLDARVYVHRVIDPLL